MSNEVVSIEVYVPVCALETIQGWTGKSRLGHARFYTTALEMGVGIMESSLGYLDDFTPEALEEAGRELGDEDMLAALEGGGERLSQEMLAYSRGAATRAVTPRILAGILLGDQAKSEGVDLRLERLVVELPNERANEAEKLADKSGMGHKNLYALAFAMGTRLMAYTLSPFSFFSPKAVEREMDRKRRQRGGTAGKK